MTSPGIFLSTGNYLPTLTMRFSVTSTIELAYSPG